jgi:hypothetical protein
MDDIFELVKRQGMSSLHDTWKSLATEHLEFLLFDKMFPRTSGAPDVGRADNSDHRSGAGALGATDNSDSQPNDDISYAHDTDIDPASDTDGDADWHHTRRRDSAEQRHPVDRATQRETRRRRMAVSEAWVKDFGNLKPSPPPTGDKIWKYFESITFVLGISPTNLETLKANNSKYHGCAGCGAVYFKGHTCTVDDEFDSQADLFKSIVSNVYRLYKND